MFDFLFARFLPSMPNVMHRTSSGSVFNQNVKIMVNLDELGQGQFVRASKYTTVEKIEENKSQILV